jgi:hypothetical protein
VGLVGGDGVGLVGGVGYGFEYEHMIVSFIYLLNILFYFFLSNNIKNN